MCPPARFPSRRRPPLMHWTCRTPIPGFLFAVLALALLPSHAPAAITCTVAKVMLHDAFEGRQLLIADAGRDVTREAKYTSANPVVAKVDEKGYVTPAGDGTTAIRIERGNDRLEVPVTVAGFAMSRSVD